MNRILIFSHYNKQDLLSSYVLFMLKSLKPLFAKIIFVSNSSMNATETEKVAELCQKIIFRENIGFDFGAWKQSIDEEGWDKLSSYDSLTLINDTCFGPIYEIYKVFDEMESKPVDFWGLTNHHELEHGFSNYKGRIEQHIQSYFMSFSRKVISSEVFEKFWNEMTNLSTVMAVIVNYESKLTPLLSLSGFTYSVYFEMFNNRIKGEKLSTVDNPEQILKNGVPLLKIKSFLFHKNPIGLIKLVKHKSTYNTKLIEDHLSNILIPNISVNFSNKIFLPSNNLNSSTDKSCTVAIHFHVFYTDVFKNHFSLISNCKTNIDLYITTDTIEKRDLLQKLLLTEDSSIIIKGIFVYENRGRDVLPWLLISNRLNNYDIVGHFHTKKSIQVSGEIGELWMSELMDVLLSPIDEIISQFKQEPNLGIIIPDIPLFFKKMYGVTIWENTRAAFSEMCLKLNCKKKVNVIDIKTPIMSYGNMFWYRPTALSPLFNLKLSLNDFPIEPNIPNNSLPYVIEALPVYLAWSEGFDFKIATGKDYILSGFNHQFCVDLIEEKKQINNSNAWKLGRLITWIPRKIVKILSE